jgi:quercetin dioxygenase-like cupin family protein
MTEVKAGEVGRANISQSREKRIAHLENLMVVVFDFYDGPMKDPDPFHSHIHEQITYVAEGELTFFKGTDEFHLCKGDLMIIPSGVPHSVKTISSHVRLVDSFNPLRQDFLHINK